MNVDRDNDDDGATEVQTNIVSSQYFVTITTKSKIIIQIILVLVTLDLLLDSISLDSVSLDSLRSRLLMRLDSWYSTMRLLLSRTVFCWLPWRFYPSYRCCCSDRYGIRYGQ